MKKLSFNTDERTSQIVSKVCMAMYLLTLAAMTGTIFYRQFVLHQSIEQFEDIAVILTVNVLALIGTVLYRGGILFASFRIKYILAAYLAYVVVGFAFTFVKYKFLVEEPLSLNEIFSKLGIIVVICGLIIALFTFFAYLGKRKIDKQLE